MKPPAGVEIPPYHRSWNFCALNGFTYTLKGWAECNCWPARVMAEVSFPYDDLGRPVTE